MRHLNRAPAVPLPAFSFAASASVAAVLLGLGWLLADGKLPVRPRHMAGIVLGAGVVGAIADPLGRYIRRQFPSALSDDAEQTLEAAVSLLEAAQALGECDAVPQLQEMPELPPAPVTEQRQEPPLDQGLSLVYSAPESDEDDVLSAARLFDDPELTRDEWAAPPAVAAQPSGGPSARLRAAAERARQQQG